MLAPGGTALLLQAAKLRPDLEGPGIQSLRRIQQLREFRKLSTSLFCFLLSEAAPPVES